MSKATIESAANTKRNAVDKPPVVIKARIDINELPEGQTATSLYRQIDQVFYEYLVNRGIDAKLSSQLFILEE